MHYSVSRRSVMTGVALGCMGVGALGAGAFDTAALAQASAKQNADTGVFPFPTHRRDLPNGLRVFVIETGFPDIVSLQIPVSVGSRNEVEPGKSGFAHFFEHMMFRGTKTTPAAEYQRIMKTVGADTNAYTSDDVTNYHATFNKEDLETVLRLEADRFQNLEYAEPEFRTEALAVLGEYNKNNANPLNKLFEVQRNAHFTAHTYKHTTMGFIEDIRQMPEQFAYSRQFFDRYYRPERTAVIIAGDVEPQRAFALVEKYWGSWKPGGGVPAVPTEPAPKGPQYVHVPWESETAPWVAVAFRGPAAYPMPNNPAQGDQQALDVLASYAFSPSSALYQRLVVKEQKAEVLGSNFPDRVDPSLLNVIARVKNKADLAYVRDAIQQELASLRTRMADPARIADIRSSLKYGFAGALDNTESVASVAVSYVAATRDVNTLNEVYRLYDRVSAADIQRVARKYFADQGMIVTTLAHGDIDAAAKAAGGVDRYVQGGVPGAAAAAPAAALTAVPAAARPARSAPARVAFQELVQRTSSPLIDVRMMFRAGAADDPPGKEGLAALTARMVTQAGSRALTYQQIQQRLFPMAAGFGATVEKETTTFAGQVHRDNAAAWYDVIAGQLLDPGFREEDFTRVKTSLLNNIRVDLRGNNDEELGNEVLYEQLYGGHPYGHLTTGWAKSVERLTIADVRAFHKANYMQSNLTLGVAGGVSDAFLTKARGDLAASLPVGAAKPRRVPAPRSPQGLDVTIVKKPTAAAAISMGYPIDVVRGHPDFVALHLVRSYLGEHRSSVAYLYQRMRGIRGMNYGDYAYTEYYPGGMFSTSPPPNVPRSRQAFRVWIRPVPLEQTHFAIRIAKYELDKLVRQGMSQADFEATRDFLNKSTGLLTAQQGARLGYSLDQQFYGVKQDFTDYIRSGLRTLTLAQVNAAIRRHLAGKDMAIVVVTPEAEKLRDALVADAPSPITYSSEKPADILAEDKLIERYPLAIEASDVRIVPVAEVFEARVFS